MECPVCQSDSKVKNGVVNNLQRYKCKDCGCNYTRSYKYYKEKDKKRRFALSLYLEGLGFHSISRLLGVSHVTIINWVRKYGKDLLTIRNPRPCKMMELDEIHSYIGHKKTTDGFGLVLIETPENTLIWWLETEVEKTGLLLWNKLKEQATGLVATDYWKAYNEIIPKEKLLQTKAETYTVESYNSLIRHFLARFRRKTKCYSKSQEMMELSLKLLMAKRNKLISMQCY